MKLDALLLLAALAAAGSVQAQTPSSGSPPSADRQAARAAMLQACDADIKSLCADKHGREVMMCLHSNADKLGAGCKDAMSKLRRPAKPAAQPQ
jgi:Cysteine rich repeat